MDVPQPPPDVIPLPPSPYPVPPAPEVPPEIIEPVPPGGHEPVRDPVEPRQSVGRSAAGWWREEPAVRQDLRLAAQGVAWRRAPRTAHRASAQPPVLRLLAAGASRVALGLHYPSDVLVGGLIGAGTAGLMILPS